MGKTKNLHNEEAKEKLKALVKDITFCMFCTKVTGMPFQTRPMATTDVDDEGNLWFFSGKDSNKNYEVKTDDHVQLIYAKGSNSHFLSISGKAKIIADRKKIDELWNPLVKAWFPGGKDDPDLRLIKVIPDEAYYWDTAHGKMVSLLKIVTSAVTGNTKDDGVEGKISL